MKLNEARTGTEILKYSEHAIGTPEGKAERKWEGTVSGLPLYEKGKDGKFYGYTYEVTEIKINSDQVTPTTANHGETPKYLVSWQQDTQTGIWTITNQEKPVINVSIHKVDVNDLTAGSPLLPGAKFKLVKYTSLNPNVKDADWDEHEISESEQNPGIFEFTGLEAGYYEIVETEIPDGYIKAETNPMFLVRANSETHQMEAVLVYSSGEHAGQPISGSATDTVKIENTTITVGNTPGAALPNSGGPGTFWIYLLGSILLVGGGVLLVARRRIRDNG
jgi:uncharacterized surface anchored protein